MMKFFFLSASFVRRSGSEELVKLPVRKLFSSSFRLVKMILIREASRESRWSNKTRKKLSCVQKSGIFSKVSFCLIDKQLIIISLM